MWHYNNNGTSQGPLHEADLIGLMHGGQVTAATLVWQEGMTEWLPAGQTSLSAFLPALPASGIGAPDTRSASPYAPPVGTLTPSAFYQNTAPLGWKQILFSFEGRIPRRQYWGATGILVVLVLALQFVAFLMGDSSGGGGLVLMVLIIPLFILLMWISLAVAVKRWHDRGKSGWWVLLGMVPVIGGIWSLVECGCLRGTIGNNEYGSDPT